MGKVKTPRDIFRESVFKRDEYKCIVCGDSAQDAHHIIERRLWKDGGYYLQNGASLCAKCHILAEETTIAPEHLWDLIGEGNFVPEQFIDSGKIDKWGNQILPNGKRIKGPLFNDESVQKILRQGGFINDFVVDRVKYPSTLHLPWSQYVTGDDRIHFDLSSFEGKEVVVTEKLDGENTTIYQDGYHARSIDSPYDPSRTWVGKLQGEKGWEIPTGWRICGENVYAIHSIEYNDLLAYFYVHSIWNEQNVCLSWDDTVEWCSLLGLIHVPVLDRFIWDEDRLRSFDERLDLDKQEGYIVRICDHFPYEMFSSYVAKWVRPNHVTTNQHWFHSKRKYNKLNVSNR